MVMAYEWIVNMRAILWSEKRSEQTRVERPYLHQNFDMAIYIGDHNRERGGRGMGEWETKDASSSFSSSSPSRCKIKSNNGPGAGGKRARECPTADTNDKFNSSVVRGYLSIRPVFETIPRSLALFVSVVIALVKRVAKERDS